MHLTIERQEQAAQNQEEDGLQKSPMRCCKNKIFMREHRSVCVWQLWGSVQQKKQKGFTGFHTFCSRLSCWQCTTCLWKERAVRGTSDGKKTFVLLLRNTGLSYWGTGKDMILS